MKAFVSFFFSLFAVAPLLAQQSLSDTVSVESPEQVVIVKHADSISSPLNWDFAQIEGHDGHHVVTLSLGYAADLKGGWVLPVHSPADMKFKHWTNLEAAINFLNFCVVPNYSKWWYDIEMGMGVSMMYMKDNTMAYTDRDGRLLFASYPEGTEAKSSMVRSVFVNYDLMAHRRLRKGRSLGLGLNLRQYPSYSSDTRTEYIDVDGKKRVLKNEIGQLRPLQCSFSAQYNFDQNLYFYLRYSPWGQYHKNGGPDYSSFTLGFGLKL